MIDFEVVQRPKTTPAAEPLKLLDVPAQAQVKVRRAETPNAAAARTLMDDDAALEYAARDFALMASTQVLKPEQLRLLLATIAYHRAMAAHFNAHG